MDSGFLRKNKNRVSYVDNSVQSRVNQKGDAPFHSSYTILAVSFPARQDPLRLLRAV